MSDPEAVSLPTGWSWRSIAELAASEPNSITDGPFGSKLKTEHYTPSGPRVIRLQNIGDATFVDARAHISHQHFQSLQKHVVVAGDIVIAALGERLPRSCLIPSDLGPAIVKADCVRFRPNPRDDAKYLNYALNWEGTRKRTESIVHGVGRPRLNLSEIKSIALPVPSKGEQREIVAEIEKQFTRLEAGVAALRRARVNLKRYRAAVLKAACEGRLVPTEAALAREHSRHYENGPELLLRILSERRQIWQGPGSYKDPTAVDSTPAAAVPEGWTVAMSGALFSFVTSGSRGWAQYYAENGALFLRIGNLSHENITIDLGDKQCVDPPRGTEGSRTLVRPNDILVSITADVGMVGLVPESIGEAYINQHIALARPLPSVCARYLAHFLLASDGGWAHFKRLQRGATKVGLGLDDIRSVPVPLPPLAEQLRIVAEVERRLSVVDELDALVTANLQRAARLRQSILQRAFSGGLVPPKSPD